MWRYRQAIKLAQLIDRQAIESEALQIEWRFKELLEQEYAPTIPTLPPPIAVTSQSGYEEDDTEEHFSTKDDTVEIPDEIKGDVSDIADAFHEKTGKDIVITDGSRDADDQASAMFEKMEAGKNVDKLYLNKEALDEIKQVYEDGKDAGKSDDEIKQDMSDVISEQMNNDTYISRHLLDNAVDVRISDMTKAQQDVFKKAAQDAGAKVIVEGDHFHVQFTPEKPTGS
jgi:hypothetical protein